MADTQSAQGELPASWLLRSAELYGQRPALILDAQTLSYLELPDRLGRLAAVMADSGLKPGSPFAMVSDRADRVALALFLALYTGSPLWPLDPRREDLRRHVKEAGISLALVDDGLVMPEGVRCLPSELLGRPSTSEAAPPTPAQSSSVQLVVATSGSTGTTRGVMLTAGNLAAAVRASRKRLGLRAGDVWLACLPLYHVGGLSILLRALEVGASVVLHEGFEVERVWSALRADAVTHLSLVPPMLEALLAQVPAQAPPPSLRVVLLGGGPIAGELVRQALDAGWPVCPSYGLSENASQVATLCPASRDSVEGDVGPPVDGVGVEIVDEAGQRTSGQGRIRIMGPTVMAGYFNPAWSTGEGLTDGGFTTSDLGYLDGRGHLHVLGRVDDVIVSGGENVIPQQVERLIRGCGGVVDVGIVGVPDPSWGQRVVAVFTGALEVPELEAWCRMRIPSPLRPRGFLKLDALPRNPMGKLDRRALQHRAKHQVG